MAITFPDHKASLTLTHNAHKDTYQSLATWLDEQEAMGGGDAWFEWAKSGERERALELDSLWTLQWYPETPVGFCALAAADLETLLHFANTGEEG